MYVRSPTGLVGTTVANIWVDSSGGVSLMSHRVPVSLLKGVKSVKIGTISLHWAQVWSTGDSVGVPALGHECGGVKTSKFLRGKRKRSPTPGRSGRKK